MSDPSYMNPEQAASLVHYLRMIADPFTAIRVTKYAGWLVDVLAVAMQGAF